MEIIKLLANELSLPEEPLKRTVSLLDEGNTVPFIARYRKELTGGMDDTVLRTLEARLAYLRGLEKRCGEIRASVAEQGFLTPGFEKALGEAKTLRELEDLYLPFRPKKKTRASEARAKGLDGLAALLRMQDPKTDPLRAAESYIGKGGEKSAGGAEEALQGAMDILAEEISENADLRRHIREVTLERGILCCEKKKDADSTGGTTGVYDDYAAFSGRLKGLPGHRILALHRGEKEGALKLTLTAPEEEILAFLRRRLLKPYPTPSGGYLERAADDAYRRLIAPSVERELWADLFEDAREGAIRVFAENLRHLLLAAPLKGKTVIGFDPGYRTGCKLAAVDPTGKVLETAVIYPTKPREDTAGSEKVLRRMIERHGAEVIAIGNGTASAESERFVSSLLQSYGGRVRYAVVSEAGASVYSASALGAEEFPTLDATERSAVSIARRLQDPLAELVKIDPKAIGVGQYQHDMKKARLDEALEGVVEDCVNAVGVDLQTASFSLLSHIAGITPAAAKSIVAYREENGAFTSRRELLKVPKIGKKAFEQAAGFLRVSGGEEFLDETGVHPESYGAAEALLARFGVCGEDVRAHRLSGFSKKVSAEADAIAEALGIGKPTLLDIAAALEKPGRDPRDELPPPALREEILEMESLRPGMRLPGVVRNVTDFGAFVDIGVHQDGLVHLSKISTRYLRHPSEVLSVGDRVEVTVLSVDLQRKRISLSMLP